MAELRELQRKLESIQGLREVVNAMRNLAAVYVRRAEATLRAIRPYAEVNGAVTCYGRLTEACLNSVALEG